MYTELVEQGIEQNRIQSIKSRADHNYHFYRMVKYAFQRIDQKTSVTNDGELIISFRDPNHDEMIMFMKRIDVSMRLNLPTDHPRVEYEARHLTEMEECFYFGPSGEWYQPGDTKRGYDPMRPYYPYMTKRLGKKIQIYRSCANQWCILYKP